MKKFKLKRCVVDFVDVYGETIVWFGDVAIGSDEFGDHVEVLGDADPRTLGVLSVELDEPDLARFTSTNRSRVTLRRLRPYDAVALGLSPEPAPTADIEAALEHGGRPGDDPGNPRSLLALDEALVWLPEQEQRERAAAVAAAVLYDLAGVERVPGWRDHVRRGTLGWAPTKVPLVGKDLSWRNCRYVTPDVAELLSEGHRTGFRREHVVSRSVLAELWERTPTPEAVAQVVWDHRFAAVLATAEEAKHIDRVGGRTGGAERYLRAGVFHVYDRLERRDVPVTSIDPNFVPDGDQR